MSLDPASHERAAVLDLLAALLGRLGEQHRSGVLATFTSTLARLSPDSISWQNRCQECSALVIGCVSAAASCADAVDPPPCPAIDGPGYVDRRTISRFGAAYMLGAMWVCWRTGPFWPADAGGALAAADPLLCLAAAAAFVYGLVAPTASLLSPAERGALTPVRQNLLVGSVVQHVIGATFLPVVLCLAFRGEPWWLEVHERWPYQTLLEPSTSTFAGLCVDGGLLLLRLAARERLSWTQVVVGGVSTSVVLAVVPCACFLAYNDGLFDWWSLYSIKL